MSRTPVTLRAASIEDASALIGLWSEDSDDDGPGSPTVADAAAAIEQSIARADTRLVVALIGGEVVGVACFEVRNASPISLTKIVVVTDFHVATKSRRRGVASTLLGAASAIADEHDAVAVLTATKPQFRDTHRYLTKLGFTQAAIVRAVSAEALRSRIAVKAAGDTGRLVAVRRGMRRRESVRRVS